MLATAPTRPPLKYYGSKWILAPWIIAHFPAHEMYCEPFFGGGSVLLQKPASPIEVANDLDQVVVTFFDVLRTRPADLVRALELTPYHAAELERSFEPSDDPLEVARRLYVRTWQGRGGGRGQWRTGWRRLHTHANRGSDPIADWSTPDRLWAVADRLKHVQFECGDALAVIDRRDTPHTLFYCDPPYPAETRGRWARTAYQHEMAETDHRRLADVLHGVRGMALISSYPSALYQSLYADWTCATRQTTVDGGASAVECLWLNRQAVSRARQLTLL